MSVRVWIGSMVAGSVLVIATGSRSTPEIPPPVERPSPERPWLTREAAKQVVLGDGRLGPLFEGVVLGGPPPAPEVRARIAAFAAANQVAIDVEVADGQVAAVRFDVTFGGCCGYEGADIFARAIGRPRTEECCGCDKGWLDDWSIATEDGTHMRASVRVNRVQLRWERQLDFDQLVDRADRLLGAARDAVADAARDHWIVLGPEHYLVDVPFAFDRRMGYVHPRTLARRDDLGIEVNAERGRIVETSFVVRALETERLDAAKAVLRARWGRPRIAGERWTWKRADRKVEAVVEDQSITVTATRGG
jgi:hypothetical protein